MKITRRQLRQLIKEAIEVHQVPVDLDTVDSEEAYGIGYMKGQDMECNQPDSSDAGASRSGLSARFAKESEAKSAALSGATSFNDSLEKSGTEIDDEILGRIYSALLKSARVLQGDE